MSDDTTGDEFFFDDETTLGGVDRDALGFPPLDDDALTARDEPADQDSGEEDPTVGGPRSRRSDPLAPGAGADRGREAVEGGAPGPADLWSAGGGGAPLFGDLLATPDRGDSPWAADELPPAERSVDPLFDGDMPASETWGSRRMDRYDRLPGETGGGGRSSRRRAGRSRGERRRRRKTIWVRRLVALILIAAVIAAIVYAVLALTGDNGDSAGASGNGVGTQQAGNDGSGAAATSGDDGATGAAPASPAPSPSPTTTPAVRIVSGGDVMGDRNVEAFINANGADAVLKSIKPVLERGDVAWVNLESPLTTKGSPWPGKDVHFQGSPKLAPALGRAGIDVVTVANNHALDYGTAAFLDTIKRVEKGGTAVVGGGKNDADAWKPEIVTTDAGATVGFLAWTDIIWPGYIATSKPGVASARVNVPRMKRAIRTLAKKVDYVVVGYHWGVEYQHYPIVSLQVAVARAAIDSGADLVIGHHPHVLQGVETYKKRLIVYSLGDLVFDHYSVETGQTVLVDATLTPKGVTATLVPVYASSAGIPTVQKGAAARTILDLVKQYSASMAGTVTIKGSTATVKPSEK